MSLLLASSALIGPTQARSLDDGMVISPAFARTIYDRLAALHEADGCRLARLDSTSSKLVAAFQDQGDTGKQLAVEIATDSSGGLSFRPSAELERACGQTFAAVQLALRGLRAPAATDAGGPADNSAPGVEQRRERHLIDILHPLIAWSVVLLLLGTLWVLVREIRSRRPPARWVLAMAALWAVALLLRLTISPRTFLHEYYHVAEMLSAFLAGHQAPEYGEAGPAIFQLVARTLNHPDAPDVIFLTNAVISSLAIPAMALLALALTGSWAHALCAASLLAVLPHHLRFSAGEDLFVQAVTFGLWTLALVALYCRSQRLDDALLAALGLSIAMQTRPEMMLLPAAVVSLIVLTHLERWRILLSWRTLLAAVVAGILLLPRLAQLHQAMTAATQHAVQLPELSFYLRNLTLFHPSVTPRVYWVLLLLGSAWAARNAPGMLLWTVSVFAGFSVFSAAVFSNPIYDLRSQVLPTSFVVLIAGGVAPLWLSGWRGRRQRAVAPAVGALILLAGMILWRGQAFVRELRDQQLQWVFLDRTVPNLPRSGTLLSAIDAGGHNLDAFPQLLLQRAGKTYRSIDVRAAARGDVPWPDADDSLIFYQGMFCYFAFDDEPSPDPMTPVCRAVRERYAAEPLIVEQLHAKPYSLLRYAGDGKGPFEIGFFRLTRRR